MSIENLLDLLRSDPDARRRLREAPRGVLREVGIEVPPSMSVEVHEETSEVTHLVLPESADSAGELSEIPLLRVIQCAVTDAKFRASLVSQPVTVLRDAGVQVANGVLVQVHQNSPNTVHLVLPAEVSEGELTASELESVAGGFTTQTVKFVSVTSMYSFNLALGSAPSADQVHNGTINLFGDFNSALRRLSAVPWISLPQPKSKSDDRSVK